MDVLLQLEQEARERASFAQPHCALTTHSLAPLTHLHHSLSPQDDNPRGKHDFSGKAQGKFVSGADLDEAAEAEDRKLAIRELKIPVRTHARQSQRPPPVTTMRAHPATAGWLQMRSRTFRSRNIRSRNIRRRNIRLLSRHDSLSMLPRPLPPF